MPATLSIVTLYNYDSTIFDDLVLPDGMDRDIAIAAILRETSPFEALYPNPEVCKSWIAGYSIARLPIWTKLYKTVTASYDPFEQISMEYSTTRTPDLTTEGQNGGSDSTTQEVSAFNSSSFQPREKQTTELGSTNTVHMSGTENTERTEKGRNISATDLLRKEREIALFDIYHFIARDLAAELCVMVY